MSEQGMRSNLVKALAPLHAVPVESPSTGLGIPDVNCIAGWMECKWLRSWPRGCETNPVRFDHPLSKAQGLWLWKRRLAGGNAWCVCQVAREWFFFDGMTIKDTFNQMTRSEMIYEAEFHMQHGMEKERLLEWLKSTL